MENLTPFTMLLLFSSMLLAACSKDDQQKKAPAADHAPTATTPSGASETPLPAVPVAAGAARSTTKPTGGGVSPGAAVTPAMTALEGNFTTLNGQQVDLKADAGRPTVLIFAQDSCAICSAETREIIARLKNPHQPPTKINLYTVLIGATAEDARDWMQAYQPPWQIGYDEHLDLFQRYFSKGTKVPALVVYKPPQGIVLQHSGPVSVDELQKLTGIWEDAP